MSKDINKILVNASSLLNNQKIHEANQLYQNLIIQFPESHEAYHAFGVALIAQNNPKMAIEKLLQAVRLDNTNANYHSDLGEMYRRIGLLDQSIKFNLQSVNINSNLDSSHYNLGLSYYDNNNFDKAISLSFLDFDKIICLTDKILSSSKNICSVLQSPIPSAPKSFAVLVSFGVSEFVLIFNFL